MKDNKTVVFEAFSQKAKERLEERRKLRRQMLHIASIDMDIEIRGLSDAEFSECTEFSDDSIESDKYMIYMATPILQEAAKGLVEDGTLKKHYDITEMFELRERGVIARKILELSGVTGDGGVTVVEEVKEVKNS